MVYEFKTDSAEAIAASTNPEPKHIWIHGSTTYVYTGEDIPVQPLEN